MSPQQLLPRELEWQVFRGSTAVSRGLLTGNQLRGRALVRVRHDVYADARLAFDHALACRATLARLPDGAAVIAGPSAAFLHGVAHAAGPTDQVRAILRPPHRVGTQQGLRIHRVRLDEVDILDAGDLRLTAPERTAWDTAVWLSMPPAVAVIDALLARGLVTPESLERVAARLADRPGGRVAARAFELADGAAAAPAESATRVRLMLTGLPRPQVRPPTIMRLGKVLHPGLAWPERRVAVEYEGPLYRERRNLLEADGWLVVLASRRSTTLAREVRDALIARGWQPGWLPRPEAHQVNGSRRRAGGRLGAGGPSG
jgi:hypothetical protein